MKFVKKLFVMTGTGGAKGAVTAEHNAFGTLAAVSASGLDYSRGHRYFIFISDSVFVFPMSAGGKYNLGNAALSPAHVAVVTLIRGDIRVELYGTDCEKRMWESNLCDMVRGKIHGFETSQTVDNIAYENAKGKESEKTLSLFPLAESYDDTAIAKVNYYSNIYSAKSGISKEQSRLEELGGSLLSARLEIEEEDPLALSVKDIVKNTAEKSPVAHETEQGKAYENEDNANNKNMLDETAATAASTDIGRYARFLYGYRDDILARTAAVSEEERKNEPTETEQRAKENIPKAQSIDDENSFLRAPKSDSVKSEQALKEAAVSKLNFYERNKQKMDRLFEDGARDLELESLLPSSRFVRIDVENSDKYYCVGLVGAPDYICYAVPATYTSEPPEELDGYCQWLPIKADRPEGEGYWVIYQDAVTGDSLEKI